jgi:hypothetical protein
MTKPIVQGSKIFDPVKFESMIEPLFVRVEKKKGNVRTLIPLPAGEDGASQGANWSKEDVSGLEQWLVNEWSGGGYYVITVTDSTAPTPQRLDWEIYYQPSQYPEKTPPTLAAAVAEQAPPQPQQQQQVRMASSFPSAFPNGFPAGLQPNYPQHQPQPQPQQGFNVPTRTGDYGGSFFAAQAAQQADVDRRRLEDQLREAQAQIARAREEQLAAQHRQELERMRAESQERMRAEQQAQNDRFSKLEQLIASIATAKPATDPAIEQLKEENRRLAAQAEEQRREREAERRDRETREMIQRQADDTRRLVETMQAQLASAAQNKGPDPIIMMLQENARQQIDAVKEQARQGATQMQQLASFMMSPRDIMAMAKESSNGLDQATRSITSTYQDILQMQRAAVEQILQLNSGGGSETIALVKEGLERASSFAERFIGGKTKEATVAQQTQAQIAQANAAAMQAQAQAMAAQAAMQAQRERAQAQAQAQAGSAQAAPGAGINGANSNVGKPAAVAPVAGPNGDTRVAQTSSVKPESVAPKDAWSTTPVPPLTIVPDPKVRTHLGRTDEVWFGPILPQVKELRAGVDRFIDSLKQIPPRLTKDNLVDGIEPTQAADLILQAATEVMRQQIPIPAMVDLLGQGRIADFMDALLPDAPQPYRDEVAQMVMRVLTGEDEDDDEESEDEENEADDDRGEEGETEQEPPPAAAVVKPPPRARA